MNQIKIVTLFAVLGLGYIVSGCTAGAKIHMTGNQLEKPASLTESIHNIQNEIVGSEGYEVVGSFSYDVDKYGMFWNKYTLKEQEDISAKLNSEIAIYGGDAIVNLRFSSGPKVLSIVNTAVHMLGGLIGGTMMFSEGLGMKAGGLLVFTVSQAAPGSTKVTVTGDVIKFKPNLTAVVE